MSFEFEYLCYHWENGAYISGSHNNFGSDLLDLVGRYGYPVRVTRSVYNGNY